MRRLIVCNATSLDGHYEGPDKNVMALFDYRWEAYPTDESFDIYNAERLRAADTLLLGRTSYDGFKGFWPSVVDDDSATPIQREISRLNNAIDKVVVSDSLTPAETEPWHDNTRIIRRADAHEQIAELKRQEGEDILVFGSRVLWNDLLAHDLVDELHLMITPSYWARARPPSTAGRLHRSGSSTPARGRTRETCSYGTGPAARRRELTRTGSARHPKEDEHGESNHGTHDVARRVHRRA